MAMLPSTGTRHTDMPELPEVETVRRELEGKILNQTLDVPVLYLPKLVKTPLSTFLETIPGSTITDITRKGKFLLIHLDKGYKLIFHFRMEGKLFLVDKEEHSLSHLNLFLPFKDGKDGLAFYDSRKFGVLYLLKEIEEGPLFSLGPEPSEVKSTYAIYKKMHSSKKMVKQLLLDQSILSGIGNIYANEILFRCHISPFLKGYMLKKKDVENIILQARTIFDEAIKNNGSTIRTYHFSLKGSGDFQSHLLVYGKKGKPCPVCKTKIEKRFVDERGCEFCPHCQNTGLTIAITGKIASGKSLATSYFVKHGFVSFSADECVHSLYQDEAFLLVLKKKFPEIFHPDLDKKAITRLLQNDPSFKRRYLSFIFGEVRKKANDFIIDNNGKDKVLEIPVLFDAHMDKDFNILVGVETIHQREHLLERNENPDRAEFNRMNSYDKNRSKLNYILHADFSKKALEKQVMAVIHDLKKD